MKPSEIISKNADELLAENGLGEEIEMEKRRGSDYLNLSDRSFRVLVVSQIQAILDYIDQMAPVIET